MTRKDDLAPRLVLEKAVLDILKDRNAETRDEARLSYESGDADSVNLAGVTYGRVRRDNPRREWKIVDWSAFHKWVEANLPHLILDIPTVDPHFRASVLKSGHYIDVDGVILEPAGLALVESDGNLVVTVTDAAEEWARSMLTAQLKELGS